MIVDNLLERNLKIIILDDDQYFVDAISILLKDMLKIYGVSDISLTFNHSMHKTDSADWVIMNECRSIILPQLSSLRENELKSSVCTVIYDSDDSYNISPVKRAKQYSLCRNHSLEKMKKILDHCIRILLSSKLSGKAEMHLPCHFLPNLTQREITVIYLVSKGYAIGEVANILMLSPKTVSAFLGLIRVKLGMRNSQYLYKWLYTSTQEGGAHLMEISFR